MWALLKLGMPAAGQIVWREERFGGDGSVAKLARCRCRDMRFVLTARRSCYGCGAGNEFGRRGARGQNLDQAMWRVRDERMVSNLARR